MFSLTITEKGGTSNSRDFDQDEVTIGRIQGNDIVLPKSNISKRHARIINNSGKVVVIDSKSTNGTYINGKRIDAPYDLKDGDKIFVGDFTIEVSVGAASAARRAPPPPPADDDGDRRRTAAASSEDELLSDDEWGNGGGGGASQDDWDDDWGPSDEGAASGDFGLASDPLDAEAASAVTEPPADGPDAGPDAFGDEVDDELAALEAELAQSKPKTVPRPKPPQLQPQAQSQPAPRPAPARPEPEPTPAREAAPVLEPKPKSEPKPKTEPKPKSEPKTEPKPKSEPKSEPKPKTKTKTTAKTKAAPGADDELSRVYRTVHERLLRSLDLRRMDVEHMGDDELRARTRGAAEEIIAAMAKEGALPSGADGDALLQTVLDEALGLGPLEDLLADESVNEIMVNGARHVFVERAGRIERAEKTFSSDQAVMGIIERIVAPIGRRIDESSPMVDARLKDGSRVNAIIPPLALNGPVLTVRKFTKEPLLVDDLVTKSTLTADMADFLETCVRARKNILISGGTGSGKTTTLNVLSGFIPSGDRIITIEDAAELKLDQEHVVSLESRPPNIEGKGAITIRDLVRNALRMRPDRIVVGECRGGEALDMLQAMNTGHDGSLTTVHANGPRDALSRLETMVLMAGMDLPMRAIRDQIASAIDVIVQQTRFPDGSRRITHITEVTGMEADVISMQDVFLFEQQGFEAGGKVAGQHRPTGAIPRFYEKLRAMGIEADLSIFQ